MKTSPKGEAIAADRAASTYYVDIDSGSTSTDVLIIDASGTIVATSIVHASALGAALIAAGL